jgi:hypothetical protein
MKTAYIFLALLTLSLNANAGSDRGGLGVFSTQVTDRGRELMAANGFPSIDLGSSGFNNNPFHIPAEAIDLLNQQNKLRNDFNTNNQIIHIAIEPYDKLPVANLINRGFDTAAADDMAVLAAPTDIYLSEASTAKEVQSLTFAKRVLLVGTIAIEPMPEKVFQAVTAQDATLKYTASEKFLKEKLPTVSEALEASEYQQDWIALPAAQAVFQ